MWGCGYGCVLVWANLGLDVGSITLHHTHNHNLTNTHPLMLTFDNRFLSKTRRFELTFLTVQYLGPSDPNSTSLELQTLVDRVHRLYPLTVGQWWSSPVQRLLSNITRDSIRWLNLHTYSCSNFARCFNNQQSIAFIHSFTTRCHSRYTHILYCKQYDRCGNILVH